MKECFPFMIAAKNAFPLKPQIMKSYSHRNLDDKKLLFNYRASRYRRVTENAFIQPPPPEIFDEKIDFQTVRPGSWRSDASSSVFMSLKSDR